jgi:hypothetical protein
VIGSGLWVLAFAGFVAAFVSATGWRFSARLMPQTAAVAGIIVIACAAIAAFAASREPKPSAYPHTLPDAHKGLAETTVYGRLGIEALWLGGLLVGVLTIGMLPALALYVFLYMVTIGKTRLPTALPITIALGLGFYVLFEKLLHVPWPPSLLGDAIPELREWTGRLI